jgi:DNA-binding MarR family transcriptional regulator
MDVTDPLAIRALAHPLRLDLLELLGMAGPTTAAQCARVLGVPQANCSFHLRQLAKYGFVEDAGPGRDRRERLWRVTELNLRLRGGGDNETVSTELGNVYLQRVVQEILDWARRDDKGPDWRDTGGMTAGIGLLSAAEYGELYEQWFALVKPYFDRAAGAGLTLQPGQRYVRYLMAATPLPGFDPKEDEDDSGPADSDGTDSGDD